MTPASFLVLLTAWSPVTTADAPEPLALESVVSGLTRPVFVAALPGADNVLLVVEQPGRIRVVEHGVLRAEPYVDLTSVVNARGGEEGLLGLAFHPRFAENGRVFVAYTRLQDGQRENVVGEMRTEKAPLKNAILKSLVVGLAISDPASNHNGGMIAFGPDGHLYVGTGDGGGGGDTYKTSRDPGSLLAKMLRLNVDDGTPYKAPTDNPFVGRRTHRAEIWAVGLRNPWRFAFDSVTGDLFIADVGQNQFEEIHHQPRASKGGEDYGWNIVEGHSCFQPKERCDKRGLTAPIHVYSHDDGCSISGGVVYRGTRLPSVYGRYFFSDYCSGRISVLRRADDGKVTVHVVNASDRRISSFGTDTNGEVLVVDHGGEILRVVAVRSTPAGVVAPRAP